MKKNNKKTVWIIKGVSILTVLSMVSGCSAGGGASSGAACTTAAAVTEAAAEGELPYDYDGGAVQESIAEDWKGEAEDAPAAEEDWDDSVNRVMNDEMRETAAAPAARGNGGMARKYQAA